MLITLIKVQIAFLELLCFTFIALCRQDLMVWRVMGRTPRGWLPVLRCASEARIE